MHTEHLQNVRAGTVASGWLVAVAVSSLLAFVFEASGLFDSDFGDALWPSVAVLLGFFAGGYFAGFRARQAAILHGIAIGLATLIVWFVLNALTALFFRGFRWEGLTPGLAMGLLLAQIGAAVVGALIGYNTALRGRPGLDEYPPETTS